MSSAINWTDENWNIWDGCDAASEGCDNCYAAAMANRFWETEKFSDIQLHSDRFYKPLYWRKPRKVFVNSMGDFFHSKVPNEWRDRAMAIMAMCPDHTFQILTKRPKIMRDYLSDSLLPDRLYCEAWSLISDFSGEFQKRMQQAIKSNTLREGTRYKRALCLPLNNVWLGVSIENQKQRNIRIPLLLETPAQTRMVSIEPLIGELPNGLSYSPIPDCEHQLEDGCCDHPINPTTECHWWICPQVKCVKGDIHWVIIGGESGRGARFCDPQWIKTIVDLEQQHSAIWVKQLGSNCGLDTKGKGEDWSDPNFPPSLKIRQFPNN
jgi:protein gp37